MAIKKIIFLYFSFLNERDYKKMGIDTLKENGFEVEIWSVLKLFDKGQNEMNSGVVNAMNATEGYEVLLDFKELNYAFKHVNRKTTFFILEYRVLKHTNIHSKTIQLFSMLKRYRFYYGNYTSYAVPRKETKNVKGIFEFLQSIQEECFRLLIYDPYYYFWGAPGDMRNTVLGKKTKNIFIHTSDYDIYLEDKKNPTGEEFIVFYDDGMNFHGDYKIASHLRPYKNVDQYIRELCSIFDFIENKYNLKVVIAAHPKSNYLADKDCFNGRQVISGKTCELTRRAKFVLSPPSTAINYAVIYHKPLILLACKDFFISRNQSVHVKELTKALNKKIVNISKDYTSFDFDKELTVNTKVYDHYKNEYIKKKNTPEKLFFQVVADCVKKIN